MTLEPISNTNIMVGYISETEGYVRGLLVPEANEYEKNNPNTIFIFIDGDDRVKYLNIDEVNSLRNSDLLRKVLVQVRKAITDPIVKVASPEFTKKYAVGSKKI